MQWNTLETQKFCQPGSRASHLGLGASLSETLRAALFWSGWLAFGFGWLNFFSDHRSSFFLDAIEKFWRTCYFLHSLKQLSLFGNKVLLNREIFRPSWLALGPNWLSLRPGSLTLRPSWPNQRTNEYNGCPQKRCFFSLKSW